MLCILFWTTNNQISWSVTSHYSIFKQPVYFSVSPSFDDMFFTILTSRIFANSILNFFCFFLSLWVPQQSSELRRADYYTQSFFFYKSSPQKNQTKNYLRSNRFLLKKDWEIRAAGDNVGKIGFLCNCFVVMRKYFIVD